MTRYLVTGGAGFIGSHVVDRLLQNREDDVQVFVHDDLSAGTLANLSHHLCDSRLSRLDPRHQPSLESAIKKADVIFHLAAAAGVKRICESPYESLTHNSDLTSRLLRSLIHENNKPHIIYTSSSEVYGSSGWGSTEDIVSMGSSTNMRWGYAAEKFFSECQLAAAWHAHQIPFTTFRLFNIIGPRQRATNNAVLPSFVRAVINQEPITIHGDGQQKRSFCHVSDLADAFFASLATPEKSVGQVFNIGSIAATSILTLAETVFQIGESLGFPRTELSFLPFNTAYAQNFDEVTLRRPNCTKLEKALGWERKVTLADTIEQVFKHEIQCQSSTTTPPSMP